MNIKDVLNENVISKALTETIDLFINEELGIADDVAKATNDIKKLILTDLKNAQKRQVSEGVWERSNTVTCNLFGMNVSIEYIHYNFRDYDTYYSNADEFYFGGESSFTNKRIFLKILSISGEIQENTFGDTIQHEVEHLYQASMQNKPLLQNNSLYDKARDDKSRNEWRFKLKQIVYYTRNEEQDAFVNGLYAQLISPDALYQKQQIIKSSNPYKIAALLKSLEKNIAENENNQELIDAAKYYRRPVKWFITQCNIGSRKILKKMMKVVAKANKDFWKINNDLMINMKP